jgi:hypothetical protein
VPRIKEKAVAVFLYVKPDFKPGNGFHHLGAVSVQHFVHGKTQTLEGRGHVVGVIYGVWQ